jgi:hypothetical protein
MACSRAWAVERVMAPVLGCLALDEPLDGSP